MVFLSFPWFTRCRGPDEFWRKKKIFKLSAHFVGRRRNCYSLAIRAVHRALVFATKGRRHKRADIIDLWESRLGAACREYQLTNNVLKETLSRSNILLNRKVLVDLSIWEPRTFKSLTQIVVARAKQDGLANVSHLNVPEGVITRGMLK